MLSKLQNTETKNTGILSDLPNVYVLLNFMRGLRTLLIFWEVHPSWNYVHYMGVSRLVMIRTIHHRQIICEPDCSDIPGCTSAKNENVSFHFHFFNFPFVNCHFVSFSFFTITYFVGIGIKGAVCVCRKVFVYVFLTQGRHWKQHRFGKSLRRKHFQFPP